MDQKYLELKDKISYLKNEIQYLLNEDIDFNIWENNKAYRTIENLESKLELVEERLSYLSKNAEVGYLYLDEGERYKMNDQTLLSGTHIEMLINDEWDEGRVESRYIDNKVTYYFLNYDNENIDLDENLKIRIRI